MQHEECGHAPIHRRRSRRGLHPRGFHQKWATLRLILRLRREPFVVGVQGRLDFPGDIHRGRRTERSVDDWSFDPCDTAHVLSRFVSQKLVMVLAKPSQKDLTVVRDLMEAGRATPVIDKRYRLSEVPDAIRYLEAGHARGKVVITLEC